MTLFGENQMNTINLTEQKGKLQSIMTEKKKGQIKMKKAFTIIELMIVMAVMAILVGMALPRFKGMQQEGNTAKAQGELRTLQTAMESYSMHNGNVYPANSNTPFVSYLDADSVGTGPQLITSAMMDPFSPTNEYYYRRGNGTGTGYYAFCSRGPDGAIDVTSAEIANGELTAAEIDDDIVISNATMP
jgi:general secretion pathway protein G